MGEQPNFYPNCSHSRLCVHYVGKDLRDLDVIGPQAVLDIAIVRKHCRNMLDMTDRLGISFRAHVKSHKTTQLTRLQVGENLQRPVRLVVSTVAEAEHLMPYLIECRRVGRDVNVLYGVPPSVTSIERLLKLRQILGKDSVSFLVDHEIQAGILAQAVHALRSSEGLPVFIKVDVGDARAGLTTSTEGFAALVRACSVPSLKLQGFYCHSGSSYGGASPDNALDKLTHEINAVTDAASKARADGGVTGARFVLSVGATPTVMSAQNLLNEQYDSPIWKAIALAQSHDELEMHAGVYPLLDLQQIATHALPSHSNGFPTMNTSDIGLRILAEVLSVYDERNAPEALVGAGTLALGREPCKSYEGMGIVAPSPWSKNDDKQDWIYDEETRTGWIVGRVSQEHGILAWKGPKSELRRLTIGDKLLIWPNHACIAGAGYGWYLVVNSEHEDGAASVIVDVWPRWRGW